MLNYKKIRIKLKHLFLVLFARKGFQWFFEKLHILSLNGMNYGTPGFLPVWHTGEKQVTKDLIKEHRVSFQNRPMFIFDVGARKGDYINILLKELKANPYHNQIYAFEPEPHSFDKLQKFTSSYANIKAHNLGLGHFEGASVLYTNFQGSPGSTLFKEYLYSPSIQHDVQITTIDQFCKTNQIDHIDILKIDAEGNEYNILKGASELLNAGKVRNILFEFAEANIASGIWMKDFRELLGAHYDLYRIVINGAYPIRQYKPDHEIFRSVNFLAKRKA